MASAYRLLRLLRSWVAVLTVKVHDLLLRIDEVVINHVLFHGLTIVLLLIEYLMNGGEEAGVIVVRSLPVDALSELFHRSAFLEVEVSLPHEAKHLRPHGLFLL